VLDILPPKGMCSESRDLVKFYALFTPAFQPPELYEYSCGSYVSVTLGKIIVIVVVVVVVAGARTGRG